MELVETLELLAEQNMSGVAFLTAYGVAWLACGVVWQRGAERFAALCTLFQGMVAFPVALGLSTLIGALGQERPVAEEITQLSVLVGTSQLLGLPLLIYLVVRHQYALLPLAFSTVTAMHFVLYAWLYRTPVYLVMAVMIAVGATTVMLTAAEARRNAGPARVSVLTGGLLLSAAVVLLCGHLITD